MAGIRVAMVNKTVSKNKLLHGILSFKWGRYINPIIIQLNDKYSERAIQGQWVENSSSEKVMVVLRFEH